MLNEHYLIICILNLLCCNALLCCFTKAINRMTKTSPCSPFSSLFNVQPFYRTLSRTSLILGKSTLPSLRLNDLGEVFFKVRKEGSPEPQSHSYAILLNVTARDRIPAPTFLDSIPVSRRPCSSKAPANDSHADFLARIYPLFAMNERLNSHHCCRLGDLPETKEVENQSL